MHIKQWNEAAGILRPEYESEIEITEIPNSELQNKMAMLLNALHSAQYQINNLNNPIIDRKTRLQFAQKFIESAIELVNDIREQI